MVLWCIKSFGKKAVLAQIGDVTCHKARLCCFIIFLVILPLRCSLNNPPPQIVAYTGHNVSSGVLIMLVSTVVPGKLSGHKGVTKKKEKQKKRRRKKSKI